MVEKKTSVKYKYGQKELDMDKYIRNLGGNVQSYLEDRRKHGWTDDQVQEFSTAYNRYIDAFKQSMAANDNRFSTDDLGNIIDIKGEFNNIDNDNIDDKGSEYYYNDNGERITTDDYNKLKDRKKKKYKTFNANRQVAEYFRKVGNALQSVKPSEAEKFDLAKHGFVAWWNQKYNPTGGEVNLAPFLDKDPVDANGKRAVNNRAKMAAGWMNEYLDWLKDQDLDYSKYNQFKDYDTYSAKGRELAQKWNDGVWNADDLIQGQAFGISNDFSEGFFTTNEKPNLTQEQRDAAEAERKAKDEQAKKEQQEKDWKSYVDQQVLAFRNSGSTYTNDNPYTISMDTNHWYDANGNLNSENYYSAWGNNFLDRNGKINPQVLTAYMNEFVQNPFNGKYKNDIARNIVGLVNHGFAQQITSGDMQGMFYIPSKSDEQYNRALIYDPNTHRMFYTFIGDIPSIWEARRQKYRINNGLENANAKYYKEGGIVSMQTGGDFGNAFVQGRNSYVQDKATASGMDVKTYEARNRKPGGDKNALEQNNGFTANDILRLTAIGTDLASMGLSFTPAIGASAITGAAGTTQHLLADIGEDGFDLGDIGRAALGYSLDALGIIPGVAAVSKPAKIAKTLSKFVPRLVAVVGAVGTAANAPAIIKSLNKLTTDEHLSVQDWQNVTSALTLAVGGGAAAGRKFHTVRGMSKGLTGPAQTMDNIAIQVRKKGTNDIENIILTKSETKEAKNAKNNDDLLKIIQKREGMADYELVTKSSRIPKFQRPRAKNKWSPVYFGQAKPNLMQVKRDQRTGQLYAENGKWQADIPASNLSGVSKGQHQAIQQRHADDAAIANLDVIKNARMATIKHQRRLDNKDAMITQQESRVAAATAARDAYLAANPAQPKSADIRAKLQAMADALAGHSVASRQITRKNPDMTGYNAKVTAADDILFKRANRNAGTKLSKLNKELADLESQLSTAVGRHRTPIKAKIDAKKAEIDAKKAERAKLKTDKEAAKDWLSRNNSTEYDNLRQQLLASIQYERGLAPHEATVAATIANLEKLKGINDTKGQTEAFKKLKDMMDPSSSTIDFTIGPAGAQRVVKRNWNDILKKYNIFYKEGGKFTTVRKYQLGNPIKNVQGNANWFNHMYKHKSMQNWLDTWNIQNYEDFNKFQDSWWNNLHNTGYDPNNPQQARGEGNSQSKAVLERQKLWNQTGTNAAIEDAVTLGVLQRNGGTKDNAQGEYQDGYFGAQEFLRHGGTSDSWYDHDNDLAALKEAFKKKGLDYYLDTENGMYKLRKIDQSGTLNGNSNYTVPEVNNNQDNKESQNITQTVFNVDPKIFSIAHNTYANAVNDKMTVRQIDAMRKSLTLYDPKNTTKYLQGDFDALMSGEQAAGQMLHMASQPLTSDGALQTSAYLDTANKAQDYIRQGRVANNQALKKSKDEIWKLMYDDNTFNYNVAMKNRQSIGDLIDNIVSVENARDAKNYTNNDILWQEMMYNIKQKANKREALSEQFARSDIHNAIYEEPNKYGAQLNDDELKAWNLVQSGEKTPSQLDDVQSGLYAIFMKAQRKVSQAEQNQVRNYYGIPQSKYANARQLVDQPWSVTTSYKKGGILQVKNGASKIAIAKIKERAKDADRFYKTTKDKQDRIDKAIARIDKKIYKRRDPEKRKRK